MQRTTMWLRSCGLGLVLMSAIPALGAPAKTPEVEKVDDGEVLLNAVMPLATKLLEKNREFLPFGATLSPAGKVEMAAASTGKEQAPSAELIATLKAAFQAAASSGACKATAMVVDVRVTPPGKKSAQDAIRIELDRPGYSGRIFYPYSFSAKGALLLEDPFGVPGDADIFKK